MPRVYYLIYFYWEGTNLAIVSFSERADSVQCHGFFDG